MKQDGVCVHSHTLSPCLAGGPGMTDAAAAQVVDTLQKGHQAMVFVHSRKDTGKSARMLQMKAQQGGETAAFDCQEEDGWHFMQQEIDKSKNR